MALFWPSLGCLHFGNRSRYILDFRFPVEGKVDFFFVLFKRFTGGHFIFECLFDQMCETRVVKLVFALIDL